MSVVWTTIEAKHGVRNVTRRFGDLVAADDVSLSIEEGEFFTLPGPSCCGKTTILRMIAGFEFPNVGQILLDGKCEFNWSMQHG